MSKKTVSFEEREINILSRYFTIDKAKKSRTINLYFDFSEDLLENSHQKRIVFSLPMSGVKSRTILPKGRVLIVPILSYVSKTTAIGHQRLSITN